MSDESSSTASAEPSPEVCSAAEALKRAKAEFDKAQAFYENICQQASERLKTVREKRVGDMIDSTLEMVKRSPGTSLTVAALAGFFLGRLFRR